MTTKEAKMFDVKTFSKEIDNFFNSFLNIKKRLHAFITRSSTMHRKY